MMMSTRIVAFGGQRYVARKTRAVRKIVEMEVCSEAPNVPFGLCGCPPDDHYPIKKKVEETEWVTVGEESITLFQYLALTLNADWAEAFLLWQDYTFDGDRVVKARALAASKFGGFYAKRGWREEVVALSPEDDDRLKTGMNVVTKAGMVKGEVRVNGEYINVRVVVG